MRRRGRRWRAVLITPVLAVIVVLYAFPIYWLIATSLKSRSQLFQATLSLFPEAPTLQPYADVLIDRGMWILLRNSIVVCGATVVLALTVGLLITYPITRLDVSPRVRAGVLNWGAATAYTVADIGMAILALSIFAILARGRIALGAARA